MAESHLPGEQTNLRDLGENSMNKEDAGVAGEWGGRQGNQTLLAQCNSFSPGIA